MINDPSANRISDDTLKGQVAELLSERAEILETNKLLAYAPYDYQRSFHGAKDQTAKHARQRMLMAANKVGKTFCGAAEMSYHLTGLYPEWWEGIKFDRATLAWAAGNTAYNTRDIVQAELLGEPGDPEDFGKGAIPKELIVRTDRSPGIPNGLSAVIVKHTSGKHSKLFFKAYEQGKQAWMGKAVDVCWLDEEPPQDIYSQTLRATLKTGGITYMTFTPESGVTDVVSQFMNELRPGQALFQATWNDAKHLSEEIKDEILAALPPHEREMRSKGIPILGSGLVFPVPEDQIITPSFSIPTHWARIAAIDFGWDHPTAVVWLAHDRDNDCVYVVDAYRVSAATPVVHAQAIKDRGSWIPVAWPHDGMQADKGSGTPLAAQYRRLGVEMLGKHFENPEGGLSIEPGIMEMLQRLQSGRLKVFNHLDQFLQEYRQYHRQDGKIIKKNDDLMSAARYAIQSLRYARTLSFEPRPEFAIGAQEWQPFETQLAS